MARRIFISFRYSDDVLRGNLENLFMPTGPVPGTPTTVTRNVLASTTDPARRYAAVRQEIERVMSTCEGALLLVGDNTHSSEWIDDELGLATGKYRMPCAAVRHPRSSGGLPPSHRGIKLLDWDPDAIAAEVRSWFQAKAAVR